MKKLLSYALISLSLCACNQDQTLKGKNYKTTTADGTEITLLFDANEDRVAGKVVNNYFGPYVTQEEKIKFGPLASTMMMGPQKAMKDENNYMKFMNQDVETYEIKGNKLILKSAKDEMTFEEFTPTPEPMTNQEEKAPEAK